MPAISRLYNRFIAFASLLQPVVLLLIRVWIARVFLLSGLVKIGDFSNTIALFKEEYAVPFLPPVFAAMSATAFELCCPLLLIMGFATRLAVLPLLAMTAVIQFTYDQNVQHAYWAMLLLTLLAFGAGKFSLDYLVRKNVGNRPY